MLSRTLRNYNRPARDQGFTLLEILIAVALISVIMMIVYSVTFQSIRGKKKVEEKGDVYHNARIIVDKMVQDLSMAFLIGGEAHVGQRQGSAQIKTVFNGSGDKITFASLSHVRLFQNAKESEQCEIEYKLEKDPDNRDFYLLMRRETPDIDTRPDDGGAWTELANDVKKMEFEYYDAKRNDWQSSWNTAVEGNNVLPKAVRISVEMKHPSKKDEVFAFKTVALVGLYQHAIDF